jgi:hypothetical protein
VVSCSRYTVLPIQSLCTGEEKNKTERITVNTIPAVEKAQSVAEEKELLKSLLKFL